MPGPDDERPVHVDVSRDVDEVGQVAVLTEELRGATSTRRLRVGLVRRPEDDDHVTAAVRMQGIGAVDVPQLLLLHHLEHDLLLPGDVRVVEVLERRDDLVPDRLVVGGRHLRRVPGGRVAAGEVDVDLRRAAGVALLGERVAGRRGAGIVGGLAAVPLCSRSCRPRSTSTLLTFTASHCGAKPWSEETKTVVSSLPMSSRPRASVSSASW